MKRAALLSLFWIVIFAFPWWACAQNFVSTDYLHATSTLYQPEPAPQNEDLLDNPLFFVPAQLSLHRAVNQGRLPFWDPLIYAGIPCFSDGQSGYFYLPRLLLMRLFPFDVAWHLSLFGHLFLAGLAAYALARDRGLGRDPALLCSTAWMLNGHCLTWLELDFSAIVAVWLPFSLWALPRAGRSWRWVPVAASGVFCLLTSGHLQWVLYACVLVACDSLWRLRRENRSYGVRTAVAGLLGLMLASPLLLPSLVHMLASQRTDRPAAFLQSSYRQFLGSAPLTFCFPDAWGSPANGFEFRRVFGYGNFIYPELCVFCGNVVVPLAMLGLLSSPRARRRFLVAALLLLIPATPLYPVLAGAVPGLAKLVPTRLTWMICLGLTALSGVGLQGWESGQATLKARRCVALICLILMGAGCLWVAWMQSRASGLDAWVDSGQVRLPDRERYVQPDAYRLAVSDGFQRTYRLMGTSFFPHLFTLGLVAFLLTQSGTRARRALIVLAGAEMVWFGAHFNPVTAGPIFPDNPTARKMAELAGGDRCMGLFTIKANQMSPFGVSLVEGYNSFFPRSTAPVVSHLAGYLPQAPILSSTPGLAAALANSPWLDLLNVGYVLGLNPAPPAPKWEPIVDAVPPLSLFHNQNCLPRVRVVGQAIVEPDPGRAIDRVERGEIDARRTTVVTAELGSLGGEGESSVTSYEPEKVTVQADIRGRAVAVLADAFAPGWTVTVDGQERPLLRCDVMLRGVVLSDGRHEVIFRYRPPGLVFGCILAALALATMASLAMLTVRRS